ncbi:hypothetical protein CHLNCDRAFT_33233 [Chlorella variabilis]|uniref:RNA polymerase sigma-70 domain-containing protein n=1 Tax=Chlorella variabilis TaxID=554065 RepID=E1ZSU1_CHLVA|nr:hypothetical protein CHLNCDRAFT_33233 [Chlorella variabilis]EFN51063.1 hypothetical protein CHLNCDRAFT_33233 [Chlorella variabilis]|eukprot:XP_005843165.1 hypothetical protein CHLNCDRAFT_33233 [Chlorella variabilis]
MQYNVRLVINIAKRYVGNGIDIVDLIPEGLVGLSKSLDRFDASKGFKFSTYAHWWIRQSISRAVCDQARVVRLPSHVCETLYRINRAITSMTEQRDEMPSYEEIAAAVDLPVRRVIHYLRLSKLPGGAASARDRPTQYLSGSSLKEVTYEALEDCAEDEDPGEEGEEEEAQHESIRQMTDLLLSTLEKRERNILRLRYGLLGWGPAAGGLSWDDNVDGGSMSLGEVASAYGLSKERIRQIEDKAMRALRKPWRQQLAQEIKFGEPISPSNLSHLASAQQMATEEGSWP